MNKVVYLFKGSACVPCGLFEPVFDKVLAEFPGLAVRKETDNVELMAKFGVRQVPVMVLVDEVNGRLEANHIMSGKSLRKETMASSISAFLADDGSQ